MKGLSDTHGVSGAEPKVSSIAEFFREIRDFSDTGLDFDRHGSRFEPGWAMRDAALSCPQCETAGDRTMFEAVKETIDLPHGQAYRVLRWNGNVRDVEVVVDPNRTIHVKSEGDHWHYHQAFELTLFTAGGGTRFVGDRISPIKNGDLVLIGESLPHYWQTQGASAGISLQWDFPATHPFWSFTEAQSVVPFFTSAARGIQFHGSAAAALSSQLQELITTTSLKRLALLLNIIATAATAGGYEYSFISTKPFNLSDGRGRQAAMRDAVQYVLANYQNEVRLQQLLEITRMSKPTFSRQFKKSCGKTLNEFLQQVRLYAACQKLEHTDEPIIDVAFACGFSQIAFFNRVFRRAFKCTPSAYRNQRRSTETQTPTGTD